MLVSKTLTVIPNDKACVSVKEDVAAKQHVHEYIIINSDSALEIKQETLKGVLV